MSSEIWGQSVKDLVNEAPARARVFERWGINYCCEGDKLLSEVCLDRGLETPALMRDLEASVALANEVFDAWQASLTELCDHIEAVHHGYLKSELPRLSEFLEKIAHKHGDVKPNMVEAYAIFQQFRAELEMHMQKEEMVLFPLIRQMDATTEMPRFHCGSIAAPIRVMEHEHDNAENGLARLRELTNGFTAPEDACTTFRMVIASLAMLEEDMAQHVHKENEVLFPRALDREAGFCRGAI